MKWKARSDAEKQAADQAVSFFAGLKHTKGRWAGVPFNLRPWQEHGIIRPIFGRLNPDGTRQIRTVYIEVPRKNGKSELAAGIALKLLFKDGEQGAQIYGAASDRDQAAIVFGVAAWMVRKSPVLSKHCKIIDSQKRIVRHETGSFYRAIPADAAGSHGFDASGIIFDELHTQPTRELWDVLTTSTGSRSQPLTFAITTAGYDRQSICWEQHEYATKILTGAIDDPTFFAYIRAAPEGADWRKPSIWKKCNPALGDFRNIDEMRALARKAAHTPALQNTFKRLYLNQWTQQSTRWIDLNLWDANARTIDEPDLTGKGFYGFLDLSAVSDMTAWVMGFPREDDPERLDIVARFWCPEARLTDTANRYRAQYQVWKRQGFLQTTPGNAVDYGFVKRKVIEDCVKFGLRRMNIDRLFQGAQTGMELAEELGAEKVAAMGQGFMSYAAPMVEFERRLVAKKLNHGGNPVLRWMADNVAVKQDPAGNLKPDKANSQGKIDGITGIVGLLEAQMRDDNFVSVYEGRGLMSI